VVFITDNINTSSNTAVLEGTEEAPRTRSKSRESAEAQSMTSNPEREAKFAELESLAVWLRAKCRYKNWKEGDELFSRVLEKAMRRIDSYTDQGYGMKGWLGQIVESTAIDLFNETIKEANKRVNNVQKFGGDEDDEFDIIENLNDGNLVAGSAEDMYFNGASQNEVAEGLDEIDQDFAEPLKLNLKGYSYKEIAEILDINPNTVGTRIHRAKRDLKEWLIERGYKFEDEEK
jgi:RNA polymerase sigma factor (sigma-70 family)